MDAIRAQGWNINPFIVIVVRVWGIIKKNIKLLEHLQIPTLLINNNENHQHITIKYFINLALNKRKFDNKQ
jgi:hypothetical protein